MQDQVNEQLKTWEINVIYAEPFEFSENWEMTEASLARKWLKENINKLTHEQKEKLSEIDRKALEIYYRNLNNPDKNITQIIFEYIVENYVKDNKDDKNRDR